MYVLYVRKTMYLCMYVLKQAYFVSTCTLLWLLWRGCNFCIRFAPICTVLFFIAL